MAPSKKQFFRWKVEIWGNLSDRSPVTVSIGRNVVGTECKTSSRSSGRAPPTSEELEEKSTVGVRWSFWMGDPVCEPRGGVSSSRGQLTTIQWVWFSCSWSFSENRLPRKWLRSPACQNPLRGSGENFQRQRLLKVNGTQRLFDDVVFVINEPCACEAIENRRVKVWFLDV